MESEKNCELYRFMKTLFLSLGLSQKRDKKFYRWLKNRERAPLSKELAFSRSALSLSFFMRINFSRADTFQNTNRGAKKWMWEEYKRYEKWNRSYLRGNEIMIPCESRWHSCSSEEVVEYPSLSFVEMVEKCSRLHQRQADWPDIREYRFEKQSF